jgi:hypothetical protein
VVNQTLIFDVPSLFELDLWVKNYGSFIARWIIIGVICAMGEIHPLSSYSIVFMNMDPLPTYFQKYHLNPEYFTSTEPFVLLLVRLETARQKHNMR